MTKSDHGEFTEILTKMWDLCASIRVLMHTGKSVALWQGKQHQSWFVDSFAGIFFHQKPFLKAVEILYSKAMLSTLFYKEQ